MKTISDALAIRRRVYGAFEMAQTAATPEERRAWLTFVLVGAGPTGVELAGQLREVATITLRAEFRTFQPEDARVLLFDGGSAPLAVFGPKLSQKAAASLDKLGVEQHMGSIVTHVDRGWVLVRDHAGEQTRYDANTVLWTAGPLRVGGFPGWCVWLFIHIAFLTGYRNRVGALLTWWLAFARNLRRERTITTQQLETRDVYALPKGDATPESAPDEPAAPAPAN
jgi:NADH dehydrogenase FAD-containing subunit